MLPKVKFVWPSGFPRILVYFLILCIVPIMVVFTSMAIDFVGKLSTDLKPYANLHFEKVNSARPNLKFSLPQGWASDLYYLNTVVAYDSHQIYIYDSLALTNLINTIKIDGSIDNVSCYAQTSISLMGYFQMDLNKKTPQLDGLFIACQYHASSGERLGTFCIGSSAYLVHGLTKNLDKEALAKVKEEFDRQKAEWKDNPMFSISNDISFDEKIKHPGLLVKQIIDIPFEHKEFGCFATNGRFLVKSSLDNSIEFFDNTGKMTNEYKIGKSFVYGYTYSYRYVSFYAFDGKYYHSLIIEDKFSVKEKRETKISEALVNSRFIPNNSENFEDTNNEILENNGNYYFITDWGDHGFYCYQAQLQPGAKVLFNCMLSENGKYYQFDSGSLEKFNIPFKPLNTSSLTWDLKVVTNLGNENIFYSGRFINLGLDLSDNNNPDIIFDYADQLLECKTSGIDETVTEAYISYEDNNMCIYFMNDKSIYQCKLSQKEFGNLKLRQLDLKPEPIKTKNSQ